MRTNNYFPIENFEVKRPLDGTKKVQLAIVGPGVTVELEFDDDDVLAMFAEMKLTRQDKILLTRLSFQTLSVEPFDRWELPDPKPKRITLARMFRDVLSKIYKENKGCY